MSYCLQSQRGTGSQVFEAPVKNTNMYMGKHDSLIAQWKERKRLAVLWICIYGMQHLFPGQSGQNRCVMAELYCTLKPKHCR